MFGFGLKHRSGEALRRGARAIALGSFVDRSELEDQGLNEQASSTLYFEVLAHQIYALGLIYGLSLVGRRGWATPDFFFRNVGEALVEAEAAQSLHPGALAKVLLNRFMDFEGMPSEARKDGKHFEQSASMVAELDSSADHEEIANLLQKHSESFFHQGKKVFGL